MQHESSAPMVDHLAGQGELEVPMTEIIVDLGVHSLYRRSTTVIVMPYGCRGGAVNVSAQPAAAARSVLAATYYSSSLPFPLLSRRSNLASVVEFRRRHAANSSGSENTPMFRNVVITLFEKEGCWKPDQAPAMMPVTIASKPSA